MGCGILVFRSRNTSDPSHLRFCLWNTMCSMSLAASEMAVLNILKTVERSEENRRFITSKRDATFGMFTGAGNKGISFHFTLIIQTPAVNRYAVLLGSLSMNCWSIKESKSMSKVRFESSFHLTCYFEIELCKLIILPFCHLQTFHPLTTFRVMTVTPNPSFCLYTLPQESLGAKLRASGSEVISGEHLEHLLFFKTSVLHGLTFGV